MEKKPGYPTRAELEAIRSDLFRHQMEERIAAWNRMLEERGIFVDPGTGRVTIAPRTDAAE